jgi:C-terminal processing protease CtpA/Prc
MTLPRMLVGALVVLLTLAAPPAPAGDGWRPMERDQARRMLRAMREEIERYYFDPTFGGLDLAQAYATADERIGQATALPEALSAIAQFAMELRDSHTYFIPPRQNVKVDYGWTMQAIGDACYVVEVKPGSDASRQGVGPGDRVEAVNGFRPTRATLWTLRYMFQVLRPQPGLHVELLSVGGATRELNLAADVKPRSSITDLNSDRGLQQVAIDFESFVRGRKSFFITIEPDVVIWRFPSFSVTDGDIEYGLRMVRRGRALVLDLRGNSGGYESTMLSLVGALNHANVTIGSTRERGGNKPLVARGAGANAYDGQLAVLVDSRSASASELLARTMQLTKRGTVLGDHTAGLVGQGRVVTETAAHGEYLALFGVVVTSADILMSDGSRLERAGVTPDIEILPTSADLANDRDPALAKALELLGHPTDAAHAGALLKPFREAQMHAN